MRPLLYFICTGNSCRSQIAEGFARALTGDRAEVRSGGTEPKGLHPLAVQVMAERGIDISGQASRAIDPAALQEALVAVTLCGDAEETCPATPAAVRRLHWPLPDPARAEGTPEERLSVFREVRDDIARRVQALVEEMGLRR